MAPKLKMSMLLLVVAIISVIVGYALPRQDAPEVVKTIVEQGQISGFTLAQIQNRGYIRCGVNGNLPGFSLYLGDKQQAQQAQQDNQPAEIDLWQGFNVDFCKALAAAIFADGSKVEFVHLDNRDRFTALQAGTVDVLAHNSSFTLGRDAGLDLNFAGVLYYDGQGFLVSRDLGIDSVNDLTQVTACVVTRTSTARNLIYFMNQHNITYRLIDFDTVQDAFRAYDNGRCNLYSADRSLLAGQSLLLSKASEHILLPEVVSKEPLGPTLREGDDHWADIVRWVIYALIAAEELNVNSQNLEQMMASEDPSVRRLLGKAGDFGAGLGLSNQWAVNIIASVGNYDEVYQRNLGVQTPIGLNRGINALWQDGGILYSLPIR